MTLIKIKGKEYNIQKIKDSHYRRSIQFRNNIINSLKKIGVIEDDIILDIEKAAMKKNKASVSWYILGNHLYYSYSQCDSYAENLLVVSKIIDNEVNSLLIEEKNIEDFIFEFSEEHDVEDERKKARETLGIEHEEKDLEKITKKFKEMAKEHHPDMPQGNPDKFKEINKAHKILKRELE